MLPNFLLWLFLLVPLIFSSNVTYSRTNNSENSAANSKKISTEILNNRTQIAMASEGSILPVVPVAALPKPNITVELLALENETGNTREKPIQARKGVGNPSDTVETQNNTSAYRDTKNTSKESLKQQFDAALKNHKNAAAVTTGVVANVTSTQKQVKNLNDTKTETPKKPLIVSYDTLLKLEEKHNSSTKIPFIKSSSKTITNDQMPSPNKESYTKIYSMASKHPGMVTPIVITILVVPMFAVLAYMAIKRGQEAWKNRHYKRMDFLLDGMYND